MQLVSLVTFFFGWMKELNFQLNMKSSLSIFAQKYIHKCKATYFILLNKYLRIYKDSIGAKIL